MNGLSLAFLGYTVSKCGLDTCGDSSKNTKEELMEFLVFERLHSFLASLLMVILRVKSR
jgi:hypothetical protein